MSELKPCPFCGEEPAVDDFTSGGYRWMHVCGPSGGPIGVVVYAQFGARASGVTVGTEWNRRAADTTPPAEPQGGSGVQELARKLFEVDYHSDEPDMLVWDDALPDERRPYERMAAAVFADRCEGCGSSKVAGRTLDDVLLCPMCAPPAPVLSDLERAAEYLRAYTGLDDYVLEASRLLARAIAALRTAPAETRELEALTLLREWYDREREAVEQSYVMPAERHDARRVDVAWEHEDPEGFDLAQRTLAAIRGASCGERGPAAQAGTLEGAAPPNGALPSEDNTEPASA